MHRFIVLALAAGFVLVLEAPGFAGIPPEAPEHYNVYPAFGDVDPPQVTLQDQFGLQVTDPGPVDFLLVPVNKNGEGIIDPVTHLACYGLVDGDPAPDVIATNQFGQQQLDLGDPKELCVPTEKFPPQSILGDHFKCYEASGPPLNVDVSLLDQFQIQIPTTVLDPFRFCTPVDKNGEGIINPVDHLACYVYSPPGVSVGPVPIDNQFGFDGLTVTDPRWLCVPSTKEVPVPTFPGWAFLAFGSALLALMAFVAARRSRATV